MKIRANDFFKDLSQFFLLKVINSFSCQSPALKHQSLQDADHIVEFFLENSGSHEGLDTQEPSRKSCILRIYIPNYKDSENNNGQEYNLWRMGCFKWWTESSLTNLAASKLQIFTMQCSFTSEKKTLPGIIRWSYHLVVFNIGLPKIRHKSLIFCKIRVLKTYIGTTCRRAWEAACKPERNEKFCSTTAFTDCGTWIQTACVCFSVKMTQDIYKTRIIIHSIMKNNNWK